MKTGCIYYIISMFSQETLLKLVENGKHTKIDVTSALQLQTEHCERLEVGVQMDRYKAENISSVGHKQALV